MSHPSKRQSHKSKVRLVGRSLGFLSIAQDLLAGAHQLQLLECCDGALWRARQHLRKALEELRGVVAPEETES